MFDFKKKNQAVEDELLKEFFPHIFDKFKNSIREYWGKKDKENWQTISEKLKEINIKTTEKTAKMIGVKEINKEIIERLDATGSIISNMLIAQGELCSKECSRREMTDEETNFTLYFFWKTLSQRQFIFPKDISLLEEFFTWFSLKKENKKIKK